VTYPIGKNIKSGLIVLGDLPKMENTINGLIIMGDLPRWKIKGGDMIGLEGR
jgi:hypothetical protein